MLTVILYNYIFQSEIYIVWYLFCVINIHHLIKAMGNKGDNVKKLIFIVENKCIVHHLMKDIDKPMYMHRVEM